MDLDLQKSLVKVQEMLLRRITSYVKAAEKHAVPPVSRIDIGFEYEQSGWVCLYLDTRPDAEPDGHWTLFIEKNKIDFPEWLAASEARENESLSVVLPGNTERSYPRGIDDESFAAIFGEELKKLLLSAKSSGLFKELPKTSRCEIAVWESEDYYSWPKYDDRGKENLI